LLGKMVGMGKPCSWRQHGSKWARRIWEKERWGYLEMRVGGLNNSTPGREEENGASSVLQEISPL